LQFAVTVQHRMTTAGDATRFDVRALACSIARAVTVESEEEGSGIVKNGEGSLYSILRKMIPEVTIMIRCRRVGKISHAEFNKLLQRKCEFKSYRSRRRIGGLPRSVK
jgi:hypothetical protein